MDYLDTPSEGRRRNMRAIRSRDTRPELTVRRLLHAQGLRFRVDYAPISAGRRRADIVFTRRRVAIFIDGCFWHACPEHGHAARVNTGYWGPKLRRNVERDRETDAALIAAGWTVLRFWEHESARDVSGRITQVIMTAAHDGETTRVAR